MIYIFNRVRIINEVRTLTNIGGILNMSVRVAINGFGRIGRLAFRQMFGAKGLRKITTM